LRLYYRNDSNTYVSGNILLYFEEGNPQAHLSPDVLVTQGLENRPRETYKLWVEGKAKLAARLRAAGLDPEA